jgi:DNA-binding response OmpR family regulator
VHIVVATDADWIVDEITAALSGPDTSFTVCRDGRVVVDVVAEREPDLAILDLQVGSKGGMAVTMALRLDESAGMLPHVPVIMLLDRRADVFLARRSGADGWLIKPLDPLRIKRAVTAVLAGGTYVEGVTVPTSDVPQVEIGGVDDVVEPATPEEDEPASPTIETGEPAPAG